MRVCHRRIGEVKHLGLLVKHITIRAKWKVASKNIPMIQMMGKVIDGKTPKQFYTGTSVLPRIEKGHGAA